MGTVSDLQDEMVWRSISQQSDIITTTNLHILNSNFFLNLGHTEWHDLSAPTRD